MGDVLRVEPMLELEADWQESFPLTGVHDLHTAGRTGNGVTIAVIDDAFDHTHPAFAGKILGGRDVADGDDEYWNTGTCFYTHGTAVAGVAAGRATIGSVEIRGTARDADLVLVKAASSATIPCGSTSGNWVAAIDWILDTRTLHGTKIITMSRSADIYFDDTTACDNYHSGMLQAVSAVRDAGMIFFSSSSNDSLHDRIAFPSCMTDIISVGAVYDYSGNYSSLTCSDTAEPKKVACYSNAAGILDLLAPGNRATTASPGGLTTTSFGGTSSATPFAAGVAAALLEEDPSLDGARMRSLLVRTGEPILDDRDSDPAKHLTKPLVQAKAAFDELTEADPSLLVLLDRSGSMETDMPHVGGTRCENSLNMALDDVQAFAAAHPNDPNAQVAVWTFKAVGGTPVIEPHTAGFVSPSAAEAAILGLDSSEPCLENNRTPLADAICETIGELTARPGGAAQRILSVSSDGVENESHGDCAGDPSETGPPYDLDSWHRKVRDTAIAADVTVSTRLWAAQTSPLQGFASRQNEPALDGPSARQIALRAASDEVFFEDLADSTGGTYQLILDSTPILPSGFFPDYHLVGAFLHYSRAGLGDVWRLNTFFGGSAPWLAFGSPIYSWLDGVTAAAREGTHFLYLATGDGNDSLYRVNLFTGAVELVGPFTNGATNIQSMDLAPPEAAAYGFEPGVLYGISIDGLGNCNPQCLFRIDKASGASIPIAGLQLNFGAGLSFNPITGELWVYDQNGKDFYTITAWGQKTFRFKVPSSNQQYRTGIDTMFSLAHSCDGRMFGVDVAYGVLLYIDEVQHQAYWVGGFGSVNNGPGSYQIRALDGSDFRCVP